MEQNNEWLLKYTDWLSQQIIDGRILYYRNSNKPYSVYRRRPFDYPQNMPESFADRMDAQQLINFYNAGADKEIEVRR